MIHEEAPIHFTGAPHTRIFLYYLFPAYPCVIDTYDQELFLLFARKCLLQETNHHLFARASCRIRPACDTFGTHKTRTTCITQYSLSATTIRFHVKLFFVHYPHTNNFANPIFHCFHYIIHVHTNSMLHYIQTQLTTKDPQ